MRRGFDDLMTPMGINLIVALMALFAVIIFAGAYAWRVMEQANRVKQADMAKKSAESERPGSDGVL